MAIVLQMDFLKECECPTEGLSIDFSTSFEEPDEVEEIDEDQLVEDHPVPHKKIWQEISDKFHYERQQMEQYKLSKVTDCQVPLNPALQFLTDNIFPLISPHILVTTINKAKQLECIKHQKNAFNSVDFIAEMLWNLNPRHPERKDNWTYIFDLDWVNEQLNTHPRPFYPFSWIWSREYAATKLQAAMRGHWVRCRVDVQEMRQFWKILDKEKRNESKEQQHIIITPMSA